MLGIALKTERWERVPIDQLKVSLLPGRRAAADGSRKASLLELRRQLPRRMIIGSSRAASQAGRTAPSVVAAARQATIRAKSAGSIGSICGAIC